jgi:hypothetical protein
MGKTGYRSHQYRLVWNLSKYRLVTLTALTIAVTTTAAVTSLGHDSRAIAADLPVVKSAALGASLNVPWSQPVKVVDPFEGDYLAVFDRNYFYRRFLNQSTKTEVVSLWSRKSIRFLLADRDRNCFSGYALYPNSLGSNCEASNNTREIIQLSIKVGEQVFQLEGQNSTFVVTDELALALQNSPDANLNIRLVTRSGETVDSEIGKGTVKAWKDIY